MKTVLILAVILFSILGCETLTQPSITSGDQTIVSSDVTTVDPVKPQVVVAPRIALYWEHTDAKHDERKPWSNALISAIDKNFETLDKASDTKSFCPKYSTLKKEQKLKAIGEFFVGLAYYESGFNPNSSSVDVGTKHDKNSWSVGLYQMSGNDSSAKLFKADYEALKNPVTNINVAVEQMRKQVKNTGLFILPNTSKYRYWAIILLNNRYQNIKGVVTRVQKHAPFCK